MECNGMKCYRWNSKLILACVVFRKDCTGHLLMGLLSLCSKLSEPIASNNDKNNRKTIEKQKKIQPANLRW